MKTNTKMSNTEVLGLLRSKNRCLAKFLEASKAFLQANDTLGTLPSLDDFELKREAILKAIFLYERKINEAAAALTSDTKTPEFIAMVEEALNAKDKILAEISITDNRVLNLVEQEKMRVAKELTSSQKSRELMGKFKSSWVNESGEEIDRNL
jgi:hypothetical protein